MLYYGIQAQRCMVSAPLNLIQLALFWLPGGACPRAPASTFLRLGLAPLDTDWHMAPPHATSPHTYTAQLHLEVTQQHQPLTPPAAPASLPPHQRDPPALHLGEPSSPHEREAEAEPRGSGQRQRQAHVPSVVAVVPAGRHAIPLFCYLITLQLICMGLCVLLFCLHTPYTCLCFALGGYKSLAACLFDAGPSEAWPSAWWKKCWGGESRLRPQASLALRLRRGDKRGGGVTEPGSQVFSRATSLLGKIGWWLLVFPCMLALGAVLYCGVLGGVGLVCYSMVYCYGAHLVYCLYRVGYGACVTEIDSLVHHEADMSADNQPATEAATAGDVLVLGPLSRDVVCCSVDKVFGSAASAGAPGAAAAATVATTTPAPADGLFPKMAAGSGVGAGLDSSLSGLATGLSEPDAPTEATGIQQPLQPPGQQPGALAEAGVINACDSQPWQQLQLSLAQLTQALEGIEAEVQQLGQS